MRFPENRSVTDQIFPPKQIMDNSVDQKLPVYIVFIDFKQAYDIVKREKVYEATRGLGIPSKYIKLVKMTLKETNYKVQVNGNTSKKFKVSKSPKQGDPLSKELFHIVLDKAIKDTRLPTSRTLYNQLSQIMTYADDIVILTRNKGNLIEAIRKLIRAAKDQGLEINECKTKYMVMVLNEQQKGQDANLVVSAENGKHYYFERVGNFNYLGATLKDSGKEKIEILL